MVVYADAVTHCYAIVAIYATVYATAHAIYASRPPHSLNRQTRRHCRLYLRRIGYCLRRLLRRQHYYTPILFTVTSWLITPRVE